MIDRRYIPGTKHKFFRLYLDWSDSRNKPRLWIKGISVRSGLKPTDYKEPEYTGVSCSVSYDTFEECKEHEYDFIKHYYEYTLKYIEKREEYRDARIRELTIEYEKKVDEINGSCEENVERYKTHWDDPTINNIIRELKLERILKQ
jgi:hypothetical protein